jgi:hypothetical protein
VRGKITDLSFWIMTWADDAIFATFLYVALGIIHHPISWWACLLFVAVATGVFSSYEGVRKRLKEKGMMD